MNFNELICKYILKSKYYISVLFKSINNVVFNIQILFKSISQYHLYLT